jgi:hypothetical protein
VFRPRPRVEVASTCPVAAASRAPPAATSLRARIPLRAAQRAPQAHINRALAAPAAQHAPQEDIVRALAAPALAAAQRVPQVGITCPLVALAQARVQAARAAELLLWAPLRAILYRATAASTSLRMRHILTLRHKELLYVPRSLLVMALVGRRFT